jgi:hypothetical protein
MRTTLLLVLLGAAPGVLPACSGGKPECDSSSCLGCCDAKGACQAGYMPLACGARGAQCAACGANEQCLGGSCAPVSGGGGGSGDGGATDSGTADAGSCPAGETLCGAVCVNLKTDSEHCGTCPTTCTVAQSCLVGVCTALPTNCRTAPCPNGAAAGASAAARAGSASHRGSRSAAKGSGATRYGGGSSV